MTAEVVEKYIDSIIAGSVETKFETIRDVRYMFVKNHYDSIVCEPSGLLLKDLDDTKITRMRLVD